MSKVVVLGAGVSGLTSALLLAKEGCHSITVVAKHMPGDYDGEYTSPWAGADYTPFSPEEENRWEKESWPELLRLAKEVPEAGIHLQTARLLRRKEDEHNPSSELWSKTPWFRDMFEDYRELSVDELPAGMISGFEYGSVCINPAIYLPWLLGQCLRHGVVFKRAAVRHIHETRDLHHSGVPANCVVNASGLLASKLGDVADRLVYPIRGQTVLVRNEASPIMSISGVHGPSTDSCYTMMRAGGGGTILGGTKEPGNWDPNPDPNTALRIMERCVRAHPNLTPNGKIEELDVIRHGVGLRPGRQGGVRLELDETTFDDGTLVIHNYGHGGWGYQGSYGCAQRVVGLLNERNSTDKAKL